jgi:hypothetical protein
MRRKSFFIGRGSHPDSTTGSAEGPRSPFSKLLRRGEYVRLRRRGGSGKRFLDWELTDPADKKRPGRSSTTSTRHLLAELLGEGVA